MKNPSEKNFFFNDTIIESAAKSVQTAQGAGTFDFSLTDILGSAIKNPSNDASQPLFQNQANNSNNPLPIPGLGNLPSSTTSPG